MKLWHEMALCLALILYPALLIYLQGGHEILITSPISLWLLLIVPAVSTLIIYLHKRGNQYNDKNYIIIDSNSANDSLDQDPYSIIDSIADGLITIDLKGHITSFNQASENIFGYQKNEVIGKNIKMLMRDDHKHNHDTYLQRYNETSIGGILGASARELIALKKDHTEIDIEITISAIDKKNRKPGSFAAVVRDISDRKHAEHLLMTSNARFKHAIEQFPFSIQIFDINGILINANGAWKELWGRDYKEIGTYNIFEDPSFTRQELLKYIKNAFNGEPSTIPVTLFNLFDSVGSNRWIQSHIFPVFNQDRNISDVVLISEDITSRMRTEDERMRLSRHIRMLLESTDEGIFGVNLGGICTFINDSATHMLGYSSPDDLIGEEILSLIKLQNANGCEYQRIYNPIIRTYIEGESIRSESDYFITKDENRLPVSYSSRPILDDRLVTGAVVVFSDISDRLKSRAIIKENETKYRQLFSSVTDAIIIFSSDNNRIIEANEAAYDLYQYDKNEFNNIMFSDLLANDVNIHNILLSSTTSVHLKAIEMKHKNLNGVEFLVEASFGEFEINKQKMVSMTVRDITKRKEYEQKLESVKNEAVAAYQVKSKFLANISHEIRTPMNGILGALDLLSETILDKQQHEYLNTSKECGDHLMKLLDDILCFTTTESGDFTIDASPIDLNKVFEEAINEHRKLAVDNHLELVLSGPQVIHNNVIGDGKRIRQIIDNLINNAIKFTKHGVITIKTTELTNRYPETTMTLKVEVIDTGIGIDQRHHERIFDTFSQCDDTSTREFGGTGLGLAICKQLVARMEGAIGVISEKDNGSIFWFTIDLKLADQKNSLRAKPLQSSRDIKGFRILVAEDNPTNQKVTSAILKKSGCIVMLADNGEQAIAAASNNSFDLILMDCQMPHIDGYRATKIIRGSNSTNANIPIIAVTANAMPGDRSKCLAAGMDDFIAKPINKKLLLDKIVSWCGEYNSKLNSTHVDTGTNTKHQENNDEHIK